MSVSVAAAALLITSGAAASEVASSYGLLESTSLHQRFSEGDENVKCNASCNGKPIPHADITKDTWPLTQCWGKFELTCSDDQDDKTVHEFLKCDGAWMAKRKKLDKDDDDFNADGDAVEDKPSPIIVPPNGTETFFSCEGTFMQIIKVMSSPDSGEVAPESGGLGGTKAVLTGTICAGSIHGLTRVDEGGKLVGGFNCDQAYVDGAAVKYFPQRTSRMHIEKQLGNIAQFLERKGLSKARKHHRLNRRTASMQVQDPTAQNIEWATLRDSVRGKVATGARTCAASTTAGGEEHECRLKCNGKPRGKWARWLPCWGKFESECKGSEGKACYDVDIKCEGSSWLIFKSCHGTFINHQTKAIDAEEKDKVANIESLDVTTGNKRFFVGKKDGWQGFFASAGGHSSKRFSFEMSKKKDAATLGDLKESAEEQVADVGI